MNLELIKDKLGLGEDKLYGVIGAFSEPDELVSAGRKIRDMGYTKLDAMSPFPVIDTHIPCISISFKIPLCRAPNATRSPIS